MARSWVRLVTKMCVAPERRRCRAASSDILPAPTIMTVRLFERAENLARQFHRRIADRDRHLSDTGLRAHALGHAEGALQQAFQPSAAARLGSLAIAVGGLELAQDLRFAHHHGIQAGGHAEQVMDGVLAFVPVKIRLDRIRRDQARLLQKLVHQRLRVGRIVGGDGDLHAVAGGEDACFGDALRGTCSSCRASGKAGSGKARHSRISTGAVLWLTPVTSSFMASAQMSQPRVRRPGDGRQPTTTITMMAALRPRHPAVTRRKTMAR